MKQKCPKHVIFIAEHKRIAAALSKCRFCIENPEIEKHLIIAIGLKVS